MSALDYHRAIQNLKQLQDMEKYYNYSDYSWAIESLMQYKCVFVRVLAWYSKLKLSHFQHWFYHPENQKSYKISMMIKDMDLCVIHGCVCVCQDGFHCIQCIVGKCDAKSNSLELILGRRHEHNQAVQLLSLHIRKSGKEDISYSFQYSIDSL